MGGGHSSSATVESYTSIISNISTTSIQTVNNRVFSRQSLNVDCSDIKTQIAKLYTNCLLEFKNLEAPTILKLCTPLLQLSNCDVNDISFNSVVDVNINNITKSDLRSKINNDIASNLQSQAQQETGFFEFGDETNSFVKNVSNIASNVITDSILSGSINFGNTQELTLRSGSVKMVTFESAVKSIASVLLQNSMYVEAATKLVQDQTSMAEQSTGGISKLVPILIAIAVILITVGVIIFMIKRMKQDKYKKS